LKRKHRDSEDNSIPVELILGGQSLRVYLELLTSKEPLGVRELQRRLGFKSPSSAKHHLDRLIRLGLVEKTLDGRYRAVESRLSILSTYILIAGSLIPKLIPIAAGVLAGIVSYIILFYPDIDVIPLTLAVVADVILWFEGIKLLRYARILLKTKRIHTKT